MFIVNVLKILSSKNTDSIMHKNYLIIYSKYRLKICAIIL